MNVHDIARRLRRVAGTAKRGVERVAHLVGDGIVARRYRGVPTGSSEPFELVYVGREMYARELEVYFKRDDADKIQPIDTMFRGSMAHFAMERRRIEREADRADFVACEDFPGALSFDADALHSPMLDAELRVERSVAEQIRHVRSRAQRRAMREVLASSRYSTWVDSSEHAFDVFEQTLHLPYVRRRFGEWAATDDSHTMRRLYARGGRILFVADARNPRDPVCGTLLLDAGGGTLAYQLNGFTSTPETIAEHTTALELALFQHAIDYGYARINLGYTRAMLDDGLFTHKRRLGCSFAPVSGSPLFRVRAGSGKRASIYARFPLLVGRPGEWTAMLGFDGGAHPGKRAWHSKLKNYRVPGLTRAIVWTPAVPHADESIFREAITETLDLPDGIEFRREAPRGDMP